MKPFLLVVLLCTFHAGAADAGPARRLAFERDVGVWVAALDGSEPKRIARGQAPAISPDGTKLAFNTVQETGQPAHRKIAIADLASGAVTVFDHIPSDNCLQPLWSPDGSRLLFYHYVDYQMRIGIVNADGTGFRNVQATQPENTKYWGMAWAADGQSFFAEDMANLFRIDLEGNVLKKWPIEAIIPRGGMGGDVRMHASPDGRSLLLDVEMAEKARDGWAGPPPAIWIFDLTTEKATRVTPGSLYAWDCQWLDAPDSIVFSSQGPGEEEPSIYRMRADGTGRKRLAKSARLPSVSR